MKKNPVYTNSCENCQFLGNYTYGSRVYDLYYCNNILPKPVLRVQWSDTEHGEKLPDEAWVAEHPDTPFAEAYRQAKEKKLRLYHYYSTDEVVKAVGGNVSGPLIRNWLSVRERKIGSRYTPTKFSGDNFVPEDVYQEILNYYQEKRERRDERIEFRKWKQSHMTFTEAEQVVGASRQAIYGRYNVGEIDAVERHGKLYLSLPTVEELRAYYRKKKEAEEATYG